MNLMHAQTLGWLTLAAFVPAGLGLIYWQREPPLLEFLSGHQPLHWQLLLGTATGWLFGQLAWLIASQDCLRPLADRFAGLIRELNPSRGDIWFVSLCAGVGEELFFRGGLQPLLGIWLTAILFVAIHGYLNPFSWAISLHGLAMPGMIAALGYLTEWSGILTAMTAHALIDVVLLSRLHRSG